MLQNIPQTNARRFDTAQLLPFAERMQNGDTFFDFFHPLANFKPSPATNVVSATYRLVSQNPADWEELMEWGADIGNQFLDAMQEDTLSIAALDAVEEMCALISDYFFDCDEGALLYISELYLEDRAYVDKNTPGLALFVSDAIYCYIGHRC